jgi:hypothetical protein
MVGGGEAGGSLTEKNSSLAFTDNFFTCSDAPRSLLNRRLCQPIMDLRAKMCKRVMEGNRSGGMPVMAQLDTNEVN